MINVYDEAIEDENNEDTGGRQPIDDDDDDDDDGEMMLMMMMIRTRVDGGPLIVETFDKPASCSTAL